MKQKLLKITDKLDSHYKKMFKTGLMGFAFFSLMSLSFSAKAQCNSDITGLTGLSSGINYSYYEGTWDLLPNFNSLTPTSSGIVSNINIGNASSSNYYGFVFEGYVNVPSNGDYTFYTSSDDGSKLWIDGDEVVDNDGLHGVREESGQICLDAGYHEIRVEFFEKSGGNALSVSYSGPGISKTILSDLYTASGEFNGCKSTAYTEAECFDDEEGVVVEQSGSGSSDENLGHLHDGDWARYNNIDLTNMTSFNALLSTKYSGRSIEVRLNSETGQQIGTLNVPNTGEWHDYVSVSSDLQSSVTGTQDIFLVFRGGSLNIGSFGFAGNGNGATDCAGIVNGTASIDGCGVCSGGTTGITPSSPQTWYEDVDGDGVGEASSSVQDCDQPSGYVASSGDNCPNDANKTNPGSCGCGVVEGTCSGCTKSTAFTEAECFDDEEGVVVEQSGSGSSDENLGYIDNNDWARYNDIDLSNVNTFNAYVSTTKSGTSVEVHLDSEDGPTIATLYVPNNGAWHEYSDRSIALTSSVSGTHDIFLVFKGGNLNIGSFGFTDEDIVAPSECSYLKSNISLSFTNPTCPNNNGTITVSFANASDQSQIQLSINGGSSYPVTVNDNSGSYTFTGLSNGQYEVAVRYASNVCEYNPGHMLLIQDCGDIPWNPAGVSWHDSYEANGHCWCSTSNYDHNLISKSVTINGSLYGVKPVCEELENHPDYRPRQSGDNIYNDIQCGNGPLNDSDDEPDCPGRVDIGTGGCLETGAHWDMEWLSNRPNLGGGTSKMSIGIDTENSISVIPTIASNEISINGIEIGENIYIFSLDGQMEIETSYFGSVNVANLAPGIYVINTSIGSVRFTKE